MSNYMFPAQAEIDETGNVCEWVRDMLGEWEQSDRPHLCFPYARNPERENHYPHHFVNHIGMNDQFWLYMYYRARSGANPSFRLDKRIYFRIHGVGWRNQDYQPPDNGVHFVEGYPDAETTIRFICDRFEEIQLTGNVPVCKENFIYAGDNIQRTVQGHMNKITSIMRLQGITPVECISELLITDTYP